LSIISRWLEDTFNEAATGIAKQVAPLFGVDKTKIDQEMPKPLDAFTQKVGPGATKVAEKVLGVPGIAPILKGVYTVYEEAYRRPLTTAVLLAGQDKLSDAKNVYQSTANVPEENIKGIGLTQAIAEVTAEPFRQVIFGTDPQTNHFGDLRF
jgi:hypothetical protein